MATTITQPISYTGPLDMYYGPWQSIEDACQNVPKGSMPANRFRYKGRTVGINTVNGIVEYWWKNGTEDTDLVEKKTAGGGLPSGMKVAVFDKNGGSNFQNSVISDLQGNIILPECTFIPPASKEFGGWNINSVAGDLYEAGAPVALPFDVTTFYANWGVQTYSINIPAPQNNEYALTGAWAINGVNQPTVTPSKRKYSFSGLSGNETNITINLTPGDNYIITGVTTQSQVTSSYSNGTLSISRMIANDVDFTVVTEPITQKNTVTIITSGVTGLGTILVNSEEYSKPVEVEEGSMVQVEYSVVQGEVPYIIPSKPEITPNTVTSTWENYVQKFTMPADTGVTIRPQVVKDTKPLTLNLAHCSVDEISVEEGYYDYDSAHGVYNIQPNKNVRIRLSLSSGYTFDDAQVSYRGWEQTQPTFDEGVLSFVMPENECSISVTAQVLPVSTYTLSLSSVNCYIYTVEIEGHDPITVPEECTSLSVSDLNGDEPVVITYTGNEEIDQPRFSPKDPETWDWNPDNMTLTFAMPVVNLGVTATGAEGEKHTITMPSVASMTGVSSWSLAAGSGGTVSGDKIVDIVDKANVAVTLTLDSAYDSGTGHIDTEPAESAVLSGKSLTFTSVSDDITVTSLTYEKKQFKVTLTGDNGVDHYTNAGGTTIVSPITVEHGDTLTLIPVLKSGYRIVSVTYNNGTSMPYDDEQGYYHLRITRATTIVVVTEQDQPGGETTVNNCIMLRGANGENPESVLSDTKISKVNPKNITFDEEGVSVEEQYVAVKAHDGYGISLLVPDGALPANKSINIIIKNALGRAVEAPTVSSSVTYSGAEYTFYSCYAGIDPTTYYFELV